MLKDINLRHFTDAAEQMLIWCHQGAVVTRDLLRRRCTEAVLFLTNCPTDRMV
jgi:GH24 family phage-related lysozyme (muramidase)